MAHNSACGIVRVFEQPRPLRMQRGGAFARRLLKAIEIDDFNDSTPIGNDDAKIMAQRLWLGRWWRPVSLPDGAWSSAPWCREAVDCAADDLRLHVTARIAFVRAQVGAIVIRQALEADEARLQRAQLTARTRQCGECPVVRGGVWNLDLLGHADIEARSAWLGKRKFKFPYKLQ